MKCTHCHTHLPEFGKFQRKVCPNCGNPVTEYTKKTGNQSTPYDETKQLQLKAHKSKDAMLWSMLVGLASILIIVLSAAFVEKDGPQLPFWLFFIGVLLFSESTIQTLFFFIRTLYLRRNLSKAIRPTFSSALGLIFLGLVTTMLAFMLTFGIHQNIEYKQNQHRFVDIEATITDIHVSGSGDDEEYDVYISYEFNGTSYENIEYPHYKSIMREGNTIPIRIDPEEPGELPQKGTTFIIVTSILLPIALCATYITIIRPLIHKNRSYF